MLCMERESHEWIRAAAINEFGRQLRRHPNKRGERSAWEVLQDTQGLIGVFSRSSVADVKRLCEIIGSCRRGRKNSERERAIQDLLRGLLPGAYPSAGQPQTLSHDRRPLQQLYAKMLPACSAEFVMDILDSRDESNPLFTWRDVPKLMRSHHAIFKQRAREHLFGGPAQDEDLCRRIGSLMLDDTPFAVEALHGRLAGRIADERWPGVSELQLLLPIVRRLVKRRRGCDQTEARVRAMIQLGLDIAAKSHLQREPEAAELWSITLRRWKRHPATYEDCLVLSMRLGLAGSTVTLPHDYLRASQGAPEDLKSRLLRLYCLHVPDLGVDILADEKLEPLASSIWNWEIFTHVSLEQSIGLLNKLYAVNPSKNFLEPPSRRTILSVREAGSHKNFNVDLLLTLLQRRDLVIQDQARGAVDSWRKKAAIAREQVDRATFATAAAAHAIASGDLDTYHDVVIWQQRFVRDPLTIKRLCSQEAVLTEEGIELLSAIPPQGDDSRPFSQHRESPAPTFETVSYDVGKADEILKSFYETYLLAKREPSFQESDWQSIKTLFRLAYKDRVDRLQGSLHKQLDVPRSELHSVVWNGFLSAIEWMSAEFLSQVQRPILTLIESMGPVLLQSATRSLLDIGAERREKQDRTSMDDTLDRMSYQALVMLGKGPRPALASSLIVQTIIDRPDASSWHRQLLSVQFLKRLKRDEAHQILASLSMSIGEKLDEQSYVKVGESAPQKHAPPQSLVKVTTVKYLAQLLYNSEFISEDSAVSVLLELFKATNHPDIRLAALDSLLSHLERLCTGAKDSWAASPAIQNILSAMDTVIPIVGSINERRPPRPEDWEEAKASGVLPEIFDVPNDRLPRLMETLLTAAAGQRYPGLKRIQSKLIKTVVQPVMQRSQIAHKEWLDLFLTKHKAPFSASDIPLLPVAPYALTRMLASFYPLVDHSLLEEFDRYAALRIAPDEKVSRFNDGLRADIDPRKCPEVQHWLRLFDCQLCRFPDSETSTLLRILDSRYAVPSQVDYTPVIKALLHHADLFLDDYNKCPELWRDFTSALSPTWQTVKDRESRSQWFSRRGIIVKHIVHRIKEERALKRRTILPSSLRPELWLLPFPASDGIDEEYESLVRQLEQTLAAALEEHETSIFWWSEIASDVCTISGLLGTDERRSMVAYNLGKLSDVGVAGSSMLRQTRQALELIKVEVAMRLFDDCRNAASMQGMVGLCLEQWASCDSDAIREKSLKWHGGRLRFDG